MLSSSEPFSTDTYARLLEASRRVVTGHHARICDAEDVAHDAYLLLRCGWKRHANRPSAPSVEKDPIDAAVWRAFDRYRDHARARRGHCDVTACSVALPAPAPDRAACVAAARTAVHALYGALRLAPRQVEVMERRLSGNPRSAIAADLDCGMSSVRDVQSRVEDRLQKLAVVLQHAGERSRG